MNANGRFGALTKCPTPHVIKANEAEVELWRIVDGADGWAGIEFIFSRVCTQLCVEFKRRGVCLVLLYFVACRWT